jgi:hypothetical protein
MLMRPLFLIAALALLAGCYLHKKPTPANPIAFFIPGKYVAYEEGNFCATWDTLIIAATPRQQNLYAVSRRSAFQPNVGDNFFPVQKARSKWTGLYDGASRILRAIGLQADIAFTPEQNLCTMQGVIYRRVQ